MVRRLGYPSDAMPVAHLSTGIVTLKKTGARAVLSTAALALCLAILAAPAAADIAAGRAAYDHGDWATAIRELAPLAHSGDSEAQYYLGLLYAGGHGVPADPAAGLRWLACAAARSTVPAERAVAIARRDRLASRVGPEARQQAAAGAVACGANPADLVGDTIGGAFAPIRQGVAERSALLLGDLTIAAAIALANALSLESLRDIVLFAYAELGRLLSVALSAIWLALAFRILFHLFEPVRPARYSRPAHYAPDALPPVDERRAWRRLWQRRKPRRQPD